MLSEENRWVYTVKSNVFFTKSEEISKIGANLHTHKRIFYLVILVAVLLYPVSQSVVKGY